MEVKGLKGTLPLFIWVFGILGVQLEKSSNASPALLFIIETQ